MTMSADTEKIERPAKLTARHCENWRDGTCGTCGVPWQYFEVGADYVCSGPKRAFPEGTRPKE